MGVKIEIFPTLDGWWVSSFLEETGEVLHQALFRAKETAESYKEMLENADERPDVGNQ